MAIQEALEEETSKDTPSFGSEDLEEIHMSGTEAGLLGIYNFPGAVYATDGSNDKGVMGAGVFKLDENRRGCCQLGRGEEGNSSNKAELGAACPALEDAKRKQDRKPILLSDSAYFLSSSQKWCIYVYITCVFKYIYVLDIHMFIYICIHIYICVIDVY